MCGMVKELGILNITHNGSRLGEVGDLEAQSLNFSTNFK